MKLSKEIYLKATKMIRREQKIPLGIYQQFKGNYYLVYGTAKHSENLEECVVYKSLYGLRENWVRPASLFNEPGRFTLVKKMTSQECWDFMNQDFSHDPSHPIDKIVGDKDNTYIWKGTIEMLQETHNYIIDFDDGTRMVMDEDNFLTDILPQIDPSDS